jgi:ABC-2 type transport system ATP-binding protein
VTNAIEVEQVHKSFGSTKALDGFDLQVAAGEVHGFLGPNGSGKSTTIRVLLGLLRIDSGSVRVLDGDPWRDAVNLHRRLAYVPGETTLWPNLTGGEVIDLLGRLRGGVNETRKNELLATFDLDPRKKTRAYSKGNRQKVALIAALASDVELLLLDEPTAGLDPLMEEAFRRCIADERDRGRTVLLSSHILGEVEALCDRVSIIRDGVRVETGSMSELRHLSLTRVNAEMESVPDGIASVPGATNVVVTGNHVSVDVPTTSINAVMNLLAGAGLRSVECRPPTLEELFLQHYESTKS